MIEKNRTPQKSCKEQKLSESHNQASPELQRRPSGETANRDRDATTIAPNRKKNKNKNKQIDSKKRSGNRNPRSRESSARSNPSIGEPPINQEFQPQKPLTSNRKAGEGMGFRCEIEPVAVGARGPIEARIPVEDRATKRNVYKKNIGKTLKAGAEREAKKNGKKGRRGKKVN